MTDNQKHLVLIVDDEEPIRKSIKNFLEDYNYTALLAENGRIGLDVFKKEKPDIILLDLRMPEMNGLEVLAVVSRESPDTPVVVISGTGTIKDSVQAIQLGAWDYIIKPIEDMSVLLHTVEKCLERVRLVRENKSYQTHLEELVQQRTIELQETNLALQNSNTMLHKSEKQYRELVESSNSIILRINATGHIVFINKFAQRFFGYQKDELLGKNIIGTIVPETNSRGHSLAGLMDAIISNPEKYSTNENENTLRNGDRVWISWSNKLIQNDDENVKEILCIGNDITELRQANLHLQQLGIAMEQSTAGIFITDTSYCIQFANTACAEMHGYGSVDDIAGRHLNLFYTEDQAKHELKQLFENLKLKGTVWDKINHLRKDNTIFLARAGYTMIKDNNGNSLGLVGIINDISEQSLLEQQLHQAQKMESIGTLAGGIAHDFNNILASIMGYTELAIDDFPENSDKRHNLSQVLKSANRAKELVKQILTFSRRTDSEKKPIQIKQVVNEALNLLRASIPSTIEIQHNFNTTALILANSTQIHQIIMNICTNAAYAMEKGGMLTVNLTETDITPDTSKHLHDLQPGFHVMLSISDTGEGIDPTNIDRIFDPFFSTKKEKGTGLGLSVVHGIVKEHKGEVKVDSKPGKGTTFNIYFPAEKNEIEKEDKNLKPIPKGSESILFVDDEETIADIAHNILGLLGYRVNASTNSMGAFEEFQKNPETYDLIITDLTMPHMNGYELAKKILEIRPDIPVIICTGFNDLVPDEKLKKSDIKCILMKPFNTRQIAETVRRVLDEREG